MSNLQKAIDIADGQSSLAKKINEWRIARGYSCNLKQQHIWKWLHHPSGKPVVPPEYCLAIEDITNKIVTCSQLRPDVFSLHAMKERDGDRRTGERRKGERRVGDRRDCG